MESIISKEILEENFPELSGWFSDWRVIKGVRHMIMMFQVPEIKGSWMLLERKQQRSHHQWIAGHLLGKKLSYRLFDTLAHLTSNIDRWSSIPLNHKENLWEDLRKEGKPKMKESIKLPRKGNHHRWVLLQVWMCFTYCCGNRKYWFNFQSWYKYIMGRQSYGQRLMPK